MPKDATLAVLWRQKVVVIATLLVFVVTTAVISKTLDKVYTTESTLLITLPTPESFETVQASQAFARSYADIIESPNIAQLVANRLGMPRKEVLDSTAFEPVAETQLLKISAEANDPLQAKRIADTYADVFVTYATRRFGAKTKATISLADKAPVPRSASRPKPTLYLLLALVVGIPLAMALAFLRDRFDRRLRTFEDVESRFDVPILGRIPPRTQSEASRLAGDEAYRLLRTNLEFVGDGRQPRSIAITSGDAGEGKTTAIERLAVASAEIDVHVLVVEADLTRPALGSRLRADVEPDSPGLTQYLLGTASADEVIHETALKNISVVPAGSAEPDSSSLMALARSREALRDLVDFADVILIDCPPLGAGADASVICSWVDGVLLVVDLERSTDDVVTDGLGQLRAVHARLLGIVVNRDSTATVARQYYADVRGADDKARTG